MTDYSKYKKSAFTHEEMQPMIMEMGEATAINPFRQTVTMPSALYQDLLAFLASQQEEIDLLREALAFIYHGHEEALDKGETWFVLPDTTVGEYICSILGAPPEEGE